MLQEYMHGDEKCASVIERPDTAGNPQYVVLAGRIVHKI
jgi:hypothetical protein